mgnify:CR=1 FL=1
MNQYVTGTIIKTHREAKKMTQAELAAILGVSDKAVSKWETGRSYPDITLIEPLAKALGLSAIELLSGENVINKNRAFNMNKTKIYVCPMCGNIITAAGEAVISCCGIVLPALEAEQASERCPFPLKVEIVEDEYYVSIEHPMEKEHYISFFLSANDSRIELKKLYPEGAAEARFKIRDTKDIYYYCNKHGLYVKHIK